MRELWVMNRKAYTSDLSEEEWKVLQPLLPAAKPGGRPRTANQRAVGNAIFYLVSSSCAWHLLPYEFPPWQTVYWYWRTWRTAEVWEQMHTALRRKARRLAGRKREPPLSRFWLWPSIARIVQEHYLDRTTRNPL